MTLGPQCAPHSINTSNPRQAYSRGNRSVTAGTGCAVIDPLLLATKKFLFNPSPFGYRLSMPEALHEGEKSFRGIPVSAGVCRGKILVLHRTRPSIGKKNLSDTETIEDI